MARTLTLNATYSIGAGDSISSEAQSGKFTVSSGLSSVINGVAPSYTTVAGDNTYEFVMADLLGASNKAKGIYFENTDSTTEIHLWLGTATGGSQVSNLRVPAGGIVLLYDSSDTITHINVEANSSSVTATYSLSFCE